MNLFKCIIPILILITNAVRAEAHNAAAHFIKQVKEGENPPNGFVSLIDS